MDVADLLEEERSKRSSRLPNELDRARSLVESSVGPNSPLCGRLRGLQQRLQDRRLQIAVLGQFKRGKSTFINALLGAPLLPTAVVPSTAIPTFIRWGAAPTIRVQFAGGTPLENFSVSETSAIRDVLSRYVTEDGNPRNHHRVETVELFYPADILNDGTVFIDTPGIGSTFTHNTEAALRVLPECDASLFIVSTDPPITEAELTYLRRLKPKVGRTFFVINKVDYLTNDEQHAVADFLRKVLTGESLIDPQTLIFKVSARSALSAQENKDPEALAKSGMAEVERHLKRYLLTEKTRSLDEAIRRRAADVLASAKGEVELRARALKMPLKDLERRSSAFAQTLQSIEDQRLTIGDLLLGDRRRLANNLEARTDGLRKSALITLTQVINNCASQQDAKWVEETKVAVSTAIQEVFDAAGGEFAHTFSMLADGILSAYQRKVDSLVEEVRHTAAEMFDIPLATEGEPEAFRMDREPYWVTERVASTLIPDLDRMVDRLLPAAFRLHRRRARTVEQVNELIVRNAESLRWAVLRGLDESFRAAKDSLEGRLTDAVHTTLGVIEEVLTRRRDETLATEEELARLELSIKALATAQTALTTSDWGDDGRRQ
jgi:GTPase Era involved in 16S rRNA processing